jgi:O-antigen/teichoic acid export membrane protein
VNGPSSSRGAERQASFFADFVNTSAAQILSVALNACSLAILSRRLGQADFGLYTLERRNMALVQPLVLLGLSVATPRYVALSLGAKSNESTGYTAGGLTLVSMSCAVLGIVTAAFPGPVAALAFGDAGEVGLARALGGFAVAMALFQMVYSIARGYMRMTRANLLEVLVVGAIPFAVAIAGPVDLIQLMWVLNGGVLVVTGLAAVTDPDIRRSARAVFTRIRGQRSRIEEIARFGLARTPGDFAVVALFAVPPVAVVHWAGATEAGFTSVVVSSLNMVSIAAVPLSVMLLPRVAFDVGRTGAMPFEKYVLLGQATLDLAVAFAGLMFVASPLLVAFWLPNAPANVVTASEVAALGLPGYVFYLVFRSYLDGVDHRPLSSAATVSGLLSLAAMLPLLLTLDIWPPPVSASVALLISLTIVGCVTWRLANGRIPGFVGPRSLGWIAIWLGAVIPLGLVTRGAPLILVGVGSGLAALACVVALHASRRAWVVELRLRANLERSA